jgi:hypothetical protein
VGCQQLLRRGARFGISVFLVHVGAIRENDLSSGAPALAGVPAILADTFLLHLGTAGGTLGLMLLH